MLPALALAAACAATAEWIRDRFAHTLDPVARTRLNARLLRIRAEAVDGRLAAAARTAAALR